LKSPEQSPASRDQPTQQGALRVILVSEEYSILSSTRPRTEQGAITSGPVTGPYYIGRIVMFRRTPLRTLGLSLPLAGVAILATACSSSSSTTAAAGSTTTSPTATASAAPSSTAPSSTAPSSTAPSSTASGSTLALKTASGKAGIWLTNSAGRALYIYTKDKGTTSECYGACAAAWPPLTTTGQVTISGKYSVSKDLGFTTRTDGTKQVTYGGHPLYYFKGDTASGQTNGEGAEGVWFIIGPVANVMK
jgi:predicted lipoprotein with Yx(FWY)xxD motif